jgi:patatin-like phospholipase/acyl hydrolase
MPRLLSRLPAPILSNPVGSVACARDATAQDDPMPEPLRVLSIDGGGIRGIIPATVLAELERRTGRAIVDLFDLIAGTSTGGILALALTAPGADGAEGGEARPRFTAEELVDLYLVEGPHIFSRSLLRRIRTVEGLLDERYSAEGLDSALERYLGETRLSEALRPVIVTGYSLEERRPFFFKSKRALEDRRHDHLMRVAARATAAAPSYFAPARVHSDRGDVGVVDGGVCVVNPAMSAYAEALRDGAGDVLVASLGTGQQTSEIRYEDARSWGQLEWARPLIDVVFDGMSDIVDYQLSHLLDADRYYRLQVELTRARDELDDASAENLELLRTEADGLLAEQEGRIDELCRALTAA